VFCAATLLRPPHAKAAGPEASRCLDASRLRSARDYRAVGPDAAASGRGLPRERVAERSALHARTMRIASAYFGTGRHVRLFDDHIRASRLIPCAPRSPILGSAKSSQAGMRGLIARGRIGVKTSEVRASPARRRGKGRRAHRQGSVQAVTAAAAATGVAAAATAKLPATNRPQATKGAQGAVQRFRSRNRRRDYRSQRRPIARAALRRQRVDPPEPGQGVIQVASRARYLRVLRDRPPRAGAVRARRPVGSSRAPSP
jgi:hypothetical protein